MGTKGTLHFSLGDNLGIMLQNIAFEHLYYKQDIEKAVDTIVGAGCPESYVKDHYGDFDKNKINKTIMKSYCNLMCIGNSENCIMLAPCKEYNNISNIISEIDSKEE